MSREWTDREAVWIALSDLFLDTDVTLGFDYMERTLADSPFSLEELDNILLEEVYPICISNLHQIAGNWSGFDGERLVKRIRRRQGRPMLFKRWRMAARKRHLAEMVPSWPELKARVAAKRSS